MSDLQDAPPAPRTVALGGGHGLAVTLRALRRVTDDLTAVVTVGDDGGSSGALRRDYAAVPPGDLRMALSALAGADESSRVWGSVLQHRFGAGSLDGHPVGNLMLVALTERLGDQVAALEFMARLVGAQGRVLPMAREAVDLVASVQVAQGEIVQVVGQVAVASTEGHVVSVSLDPPSPAPCEEATQAVLDADLVVLGPGSWFTSVLPHLLVPDLAAALVATPAVRVVSLNLVPQTGETSGFSPENHLEVLSSYAPDLRVDAVIADTSTVPDVPALAAITKSMGGELILGDIRDPHDRSLHAALPLASAYSQAWERGRIGH